MRSPTSSLVSANPIHNQLIQLISPQIIPLGYQIVYLEIQSHLQKTLRIYIDYAELRSDKTIGIEDCVKVSRALDEFLDQNLEVQSILPGTYELEVSSPGVDRPLRTADDFQRFTGKDVRIHVYRPMTREEIENSSYLERNPKQKNFLGTLLGLQDNKLVLSLSLGGQDTQEPGKKNKMVKKVNVSTNSVEERQISIPLPLISKANLEPHFDFERSDERE